MIQYLFLSLVRIIGTFSQENNFSLVFDEKNFDDTRSKLYKGRFIILEPEIIISSTSIITAEPCPRVPLLRELFKKIRMHSRLSVGVWKYSSFSFQKDNWKYFR